MHRNFFKILSRNPDYVERFAMIEVILSILRVEDGIHKIIRNIDIV